MHFNMSHNIHRKLHNVSVSFSLLGPNDVGTPLPNNPKNAISKGSLTINF